MNMIWTAIKVEVGERFGFWGEGVNNKSLEIGDIIYLWRTRDDCGLGDEIVYGSAKIVDCLNKENYYSAVRIED